LTDWQLLNSGTALIGKTRVFFPDPTRLGRSTKPSVSRQIFGTTTFGGVTSLGDDVVGFSFLGGFFA